jgi:3-oxoacyl-[acyl-carrier protein] reductase
LGLFNINQNMPTAFITGASSGIGAAISKNLWEQGFDLILSSKNKEKLNAFSNEFVEKPNQKIECFAADLTEKKELKALIEFLNQKTELDILINNAGLYNDGNFTEESDEVFEKLIDLNLKAPYFLSKRLIEQIAKSQNPHIINICSVTVKKARKEAAAYTISKMGMEGLNKILASECKERNIRNTNIYPAAVNTESWDGIEAPKNQFIQAKDIADLIIHCINSPKTINFDEIHLSNPVNY